MSCCRTSRCNKFRERGVNSSPRSWTDSPNSSPKAGPSNALEEDPSAGYNSGDEYGPAKGLSVADWAEVCDIKLAHRTIMIAQMKFVRLH